MKTSLLKVLAIVFKTFVAVTAISVLCFFAIGIQTKKMADDVWKQLGITTPDANHNIKNSILNGSLYYYGAKNARNILAGDRIAVINGMVAHAKKYSSSAEFKTAYKKYREGMMPKAVEYVPASPDSIRRQEKRRLEMSLKSAEEGLNSPNPKIKNGAPARIEHVKKELAALDDPNNKNIQRLIDQENRMYEGYKKQHEDKMKKFEQKYPEDPQVLIKKRLEEILAITADVDYAAELEEKEWRPGKKVKVFVNPVYERKSKEWKLAFRAGKASTDAVRAAAEEWLKEFK